MHMSSAKYNPFKPGSIIHPGMFAGRFDELKTLEKALFQTKNGNPHHFLIHGERGIGKSSLLMILNLLATENRPTPDLGEEFNFLTVEVELEPHDTYKDLLAKIARQLQRELDKDEAIKKKLKDFWSFLTNWEVLGVKYNRETVPTEAFLEELCDKFSVIAKNLTGTKSGVYLFIDEADKADASAGLGEFVKVFTERLSKNGAGNVALGVIGISNVIEKMKASHESSVRILTPIHLKQLTEDDRNIVVERGLKEANQKNKVATSITPSALEMISNFSEGYPYFIQQYAFSAFDHDTDNEIDQNDVAQALTKENGALQLLGQRYFENMYTDEIRSDDYRKVLQVLATHMPKEVSRKQIIEESKLKDHTVSNALTALKKKGSIVAISGTDGKFRLPSMSFGAWILAFKAASKLE